ncbi:CBS domain-containing protein [Nonomuraea sp. NPDC005983]|uniref:CBS domain-containing protein n=1 Tax=Nonomuraea sp. NPDC005983 TaxID=3155595 RepID=UPI0033BA97F4
MRAVGTDPVGVVHIRDAYLARRRGTATTAGHLAYRIPTLLPDVSVAEAVAQLRTARSQTALVRAGDGTVAGLITLDDLLTTLLVAA